MQKFNQINFIKKLISFSPRQLAGEIKTANYICAILDKYRVKYQREYFQNFIPVSRATLKADGQNIPCEGTGFVGGKINGRKSIVNMLELPNDYRKANINFNPHCPEISPGLFFWKPALVIASRDLPRLLCSKKISGQVLVKKTKHRSSNILVGNTKNPKNIFFCHYDCHHTGAVDNASGTSVMMSVIINYSELLKNNLYVIAGAEELSYDKQPAYWGFGYRIFEKKYYQILSQAKNIYVVDGLGFTKPEITIDPIVVYESFPIKHSKKFRRKIKIITMKIEDLMPFYHSVLDQASLIKLKYLDQANKVVKNFSK